MTLFRTIVLFSAFLLASACGSQEAQNYTDTAKEPAQTTPETDREDNSTFSLSFRCFGSEPFWSLRLDDEAMTLQTPERSGEDALRFPGGWDDNPASADGHSWSATKGTAQLLILKEQCIAESGQEFNYATDAASLLNIDMPASGCCEAINTSPPNE